MAFVSQRKPMGGKYQNCREPFIRFRKSLSGACCGSINRAVPFRGKRIELEIDFDEKLLRISEHPEGFSVEPSGGQFSCSKSVVEEVGTERIWLTLHEDGWWYGNYGQSNQGE